MSLTDFMINFPFLSFFILNRKKIIYKILTITFPPTFNPEKTLKEFLLVTPISWLTESIPCSTQHTKRPLSVFRKHLNNFIQKSHERTFTVTRWVSWQEEDWERWEAYSVCVYNCHTGCPGYFYFFFSCGSAVSKVQYLYGFHNLPAHAFSLKSISALWWRNNPTTKEAVIVFFFQLKTSSSFD